jgi:hypothetical protein
MRILAIAFAGALSACIAVPVSAAQLPTDAQCHALARQRGAAEESGSRNHERFIRDCVAGRIPFETPGIPASVRDYRAQSSDLCHELARQRGAGEGTGNRNHERFTTQCMAGKIPVTEARRIGTETADLRKRSEAECDALSRQRGAGEASVGTRNHERFVRACMAGKVS